MTPKDYISAADYLHDSAQFLKLQFTEPGKYGSKWKADADAQRAKREFDEMLELAGKLRQVAREHVFG